MTFSVKLPYLPLKNGSMDFRLSPCKLAAPFPVMNNECGAGGKTREKQE